MLSPGTQYHLATTRTERTAARGKVWFLALVIYHEQSFMLVPFVLK